MVILMPPTQLTPMPFPRPSCPYPNVHRSATSPARFRRSTKYYPKETQGFCTHPFPKTGNGLLFMCQKYIPQKRFGISSPPKRTGAAIGYIRHADSIFLLVKSRPINGAVLVAVESQKCETNSEETSSDLTLRKTQSNSTSVKK